jgi:superfamily II DNA or RNA helicase
MVIMRVCSKCESSLESVATEEGAAAYICSAASVEDRENQSGCGEIIYQYNDDMEDGNNDSDKENDSAASSPLFKPQKAKLTSAAPHNSKKSLIIRQAKSSIPITAMNSSLPQCLGNSKLSLASRLRQKVLQREAELASQRSTDAAQAQLNSSQILSGEINVIRAPIMSSLSIKGHENANSSNYLRNYMRPKVQGLPSSDAEKLMNNGLHRGRRLGARGKPFSGVWPTMKPTITPESTEADKSSAIIEAKANDAHLIDGIERLIIWQRGEEAIDDPSKDWAECIEVPPFLCKFLRPHQREGVKFMAECCLSLRKFRGCGAILADDMGLGKTLQSVTLLYTLLTQGFEKAKPVARRVLIITPTSLVQNWNNEIKKWLDGRIDAIALSESHQADVINGIESFFAYGCKSPVLIISYDTFRRHAQRFIKPVDLIICDEAHRLKNNKTGTYVALDALECKRRVLLSGTPLQNNLDEFFAMINFTNPGVMGDRSFFKRYYEAPILQGREPDAIEEEQSLCAVRSAEMSAIVNQFVLRRTNVLLSKHLPPKVMQIVCCRPTKLQLDLYSHFCRSKFVKRMLTESGGSVMQPQVLPLITSLKKLCNHPKLIWDAINNANKPANKSAKVSKTSSVAGDDDLEELIGIDYDSVGSKEASDAFTGCDKFFSQQFKQNPFHAGWSGKMYVLIQLLTTIRRSTDDRFVIVSNFTSALDIIGEIAKQKKWDYLRLDGSTSVKQRQKLVDQLGDKNNKVFLFLLSSRAGGCGLNLIGANRLVLFDPDWNPAVDKQAAARVWRDGQSKRCFIYRFLTTGSIEEKIFQRQLTKEGLAGVLGGGTGDSTVSSEELKDLFRIRCSAENNFTPSDTHDTLDCTCLQEILQTQQEIQENQQPAAATAEAAEPAINEDEEEQSIQVDKSLAQLLGEEATEIKAQAMAVTEQSNEGREDECDVAGSSDDDFVVKDDEEEMSEGGEDFSPKAKKKGGNSNPLKRISKKNVVRDTEKSRKRKDRQLARVLHPEKAKSMQKALLGQRGAPPEEELINWAHHITCNSVPDPLLRLANKEMAPSHEGWPFVSFVFSCEVAGKSLAKLNLSNSGAEMIDSDALLFSKYSAKCDLAPVMVKRAQEQLMSAEEALEKHEAVRIEYEKKKRKRLGYNNWDEMDGQLDLNMPRRQSMRVAVKEAERSHQQQLEQIVEGNESNKFIRITSEGDSEDSNKQPEEGEESKEASQSSKSSKKPASTLRSLEGYSLDSYDDATAAAILQAQQELSKTSSKAGKNKAPKAATSTKLNKAKKARIEMSDSEDEPLEKNIGNFSNLTATPHISVPPPVAITASQYDSSQPSQDSSCMEEIINKPINKAALYPTQPPANLNLSSTLIGADQRPLKKKVISLDSDKDEEFN